MAKNIITEDDDKKPEEELVVTETAPVEAKPDGKVNATKPDDKSAKVEDEDEDDVEAEGAATSDAERDAIRERRRKERADRKEKRDKAMARDKLERDFLLKRNDELERRIAAQEQRAVQQDFNSFDAAIAKAQRDVQMAEQVIAKAVAAGNGEDVATAMRYRDQAAARAQQAAMAKQNAQAQVQQRTRESAAPKMDPVIASHAQKFLAENPWYDASGGNEESGVVLAIDQQLTREKYDPRSEDYWNELRARAAKRLPERFQAPASDEASRTPRGGPNIGSGKEHAPASTRREVYISPERKQALIDAGVWGDPVLRMKYVKRYADYDREQASRGREG